MRLPILAAATGLALAASQAPALAAKAARTTIPVDAIDANGTGARLGTIEAQDTKEGLKLTPRLGGLPPGPHGFHIHDNGSCAPKEQDGKMVPGLAAGGHFDPDHSAKHQGPWGAGHKGDMPALAVNGDGSATDPVVVPRLKVADIKGHAIVIHAGADNYADDPKPLGGGGARIACGVAE
jgi:Cu-Zn family superoxide dismutase